MGDRRQFLLSTLLILAIGAPACAEDVDQILRDWSDHRLKNPQSGVHATGRLYLYDQVFKTETRAVVEFWIRSSGESRFDFTPTEPAPGEASRIIGPNGAPYSLKTQQPQRWVFTPGRMRQFVVGPANQPNVHDVDLSPLSESDGFFTVSSRRRTDRWCSSLEQHFGFLKCDPQFLVEDSLCSNWQVRLGVLHGSRDRIHLIVTPAAETVSPPFSRQEILLNRDFTPLAFRSFDPAGTSETVYAYTTWKPLEDNTEAFTDASLSHWPPGRRTNPPIDTIDDRPPPPPFAVLPENNDH